MNANRKRLRGAAAWAMLSALGLATAAVPAQAQPKASVSSSESASAKVTVKSIDLKTRQVVVTGETGETFSIKAPPEARNFDQLEAGDTVAVTYTISTEYVLSAPNTPLPADAVAVIDARTAKGERPGGVVANNLVVTGAVIAIDVAKHTLKLVSPEGGAVHTVTVKTAEGRKAMAQMKVGDTITAYVTESLLLTVQPL